jgi:hypothetical protein
MTPLSELEQQLLERLAEAGKPSPLLSGELRIAASLERADLLFIKRDGAVQEAAIITPKGRRLLAELAQRPLKHQRPPFRFSD